MLMLWFIRTNAVLYIEWTICNCAIWSCKPRDGRSVEPKSLHSRWAGEAEAAVYFAYGCTARPFHWSRNISLPLRSYPYFCRLIPSSSSFSSTHGAFRVEHSATHGLRIWLTIKTQVPQVRFIIQQHRNRVKTFSFTRTISSARVVLDFICKYFCAMKFAIFVRINFIWQVKWQSDKRKGKTIFSHDCNLNNCFGIYQIFYRETWQFLDKNRKKIIFNYFNYFLSTQTSAWAIMKNKNRNVKCLLLFTTSSQKNEVQSN